MVKVIEQSALYEHSEIASHVIHPAMWTAIIPAAGRGTRLGHSLPKALFEVAGKSLLSWVVEKIENDVGKIVLVISAAEEKLFRDFIQKQKQPDKFEISFQLSPHGTVDAIASAESSVTTRYSLVVWGDHFSVQRTTLHWIMKAHEVRPFAKLTLATCMRENPYIHLVRGDQGKIVKVLQARDEMLPRFGENDCGSFAFSTASLFENCRKALRESFNEAGDQRELNLLTLFPRFEGDEGEVQTLRIATESETLGLNTKEEAAVAKKILEEKTWIAAK